MAINMSALLKGWNAQKEGAENIQSSYNMLKMVGTEHARIHEGLGFHIGEKLSVAIGSETNYFISVVSASGLVHLRAFNYVSNNGECDIYLYENPYIDVNSLGVGLTPNNMNRNSSNLSVNSFYRNALGFDANSAGTELDFNFIEASAGGPIKTSGGALGDIGGEWVLKPGNNYLIRLNNRSGSLITLKSHVFFYEVQG